MIKELLLPLTDDSIAGLKAGDQVLLTGEVLTGRDAAHKRLYEALQAGDALPVDVAGQVIYYMGPSPTPPGKVIGAAGPTTSHRMDAYTPALLEAGLKGMIGKGNRTVPVTDSMIKNKAVYFAAIGGAGALLQDRIIENTVIAYDDLGTEAIRRLKIDKFPVTVVIDSSGNNLYETQTQVYQNVWSKLNNEERR